MLPQMSPYTPSLYQPDSYGRFRLYPHTTETPIPGAGYQVGKLVWKEQELNLNGSRQPQVYGNYSQVPLRGLGAEALQTMQLRTPLLISSGPSGGAAPPPPGDGSQGGPSSTEMDYGYDVSSEIEGAAAAAEIAAAQAAAQAAEQGGRGFFSRTVGPVPYWAIGLAGLAVVGGGGFLLYRRRRKVKGNRRRRRRR